MSEPRSMHIGEMAGRAEMSVRTVRHYDEIGLLRPTGRSEGGFRLYTELDLDRLLVIRRMKPLGYSLEQSADLLRLVDASLRSEMDGAARKELRDLLEDARARRARLAQQVRWADEFIEILRHRLPAESTVGADDVDAGPPAGER